MAIKKTVKDIIKKVTTKKEGATFNEYGVCIECQGGCPDCKHNNLVETNGGTYCVLCGLKVS